MVFIAWHQELPLAVDFPPAGRFITEGFGCELRSGLNRVPQTILDAFAGLDVVLIPPGGTDPVEGRELFVTDGDGRERCSVCAECADLHAHMPLQSVVAQHLRLHERTEVAQRNEDLFALRRDRHIAEETVPDGVGLWVV